MAKQQTVVLIDDLDGSTAEQTVTFSVDGQHYEIDLSRQNIQRLRDILAPFMTKARRTRAGLGTVRQAQRPRTAVPSTAGSNTEPHATRIPAAPETTARDNSTTPAPRPPLPAAVFSNPDNHVPARGATTSQARTAGLFSAPR